MSDIEFKPWPKIPRDNPFKVTITEKIDGTNGCIVIQDGKIVGVQSRKRFITPEDDNYGFAAWVAENEEELLKLGDGYHYGEWAGSGIQKNPHVLVNRHFFLFNTFRWGKHNSSTPKCCKVVPVLYQGQLAPDTVDLLFQEFADKVAEDPFYSPEGVVVYYHAFRTYTKHTIKSPDGKWCKG